MASALTNASRLRILALPLTRPLPSKQRTALTYFHFQLASERQKAPPSGEYTRSPDESRTRAAIRWATNKASTTWAGWGKAKGGWKLALFRWGEAVVDRIDFEELALKGVDPSLGPTIRHPIRGNNADTKQIPLLYPPSILSSSEILKQLSGMVSFRKPKHLRGVYMWVAISPFTLPFAIIPIIPNIPFFFCAWRAWSHYRAYRASGYLENLLQSGMVVPEESKPLDSIYESSEAEKEQASLLINEAGVTKVVEEFSLSGHAENDMIRAVEQARLRQTV